jgi:hypothetical protein
MAQISRALALERLGDYLGAAKSLMGTLDGIDASPEWDGVFERIAADLEKVGEDAEAGFCDETAGQLMLAGDSSRVARKASQAPLFVQSASERYYSRCGSEDEMASARTRAIRAVLERTCPPE